MRVAGSHVEEASPVSVLLPADVRPRLNKTSAADDAEIQDLIDAAEGEFAELVGPLAATAYTEKHRGSLLILDRRPVVSVQSVADAYGTVLVADDYELSADAGLLTVVRPGTYTVAYTAGYAVLPGNIRELIIADVAGYFARTQRGGGSVRGGFPGDEFAEPIVESSPVSMWPRIAAYARRHTVALA
jgi:hypothetical protein